MSPTGPPEGHGNKQPPTTITWPSGFSPHRKPLGLFASVANTGSDVAYLAYRRMLQIRSTAREPQDSLFAPVVAAAKRLRNAELKTAVSATPAFAGDDAELPPPPSPPVFAFFAGDAGSARSV